MVVVTSTQSCFKPQKVKLCVVILNIMQKCGITVVSACSKWTFNCRFKTGISYQNFGCVRTTVVRSHGPISNFQVPYLILPSAAGGCPANWFMYGNNCYQIHGDSTLCDASADSENLNCFASWQDANKQCKNSGGDLAAIHDKYYNGKDR